MGIQDIEQTVRKSPHEEEDGDEADWENGFPCGDVSCTGDSVVIDWSLYDDLALATITIDTS